jgi:PEP-CTERM motif
MDGFGNLLRYHLAGVPDPAMLVLIGTGVAGLGLLWRRYVHRRAARPEGAPRNPKSSAVRNGSSPNDA